MRAVTSASGVSRVICCGSCSAAMTAYSMISPRNNEESPAGRGAKIMAERLMNLRGLKCPLPALRTRKALAGLAAGDVLVVECTDPLAAIDIPNLINQTGDVLEKIDRGKKVLTFHIRKR
jgi:tRNA 2-thiouridine synthesizing protein A